MKLLAVYGFGCAKELLFRPIIDCAKELLLRAAISKIFTLEICSF
jgi:hypothetical protein